MLIFCISVMSNSCVVPSKLWGGSASVRLTGQGTKTRFGVFTKKINTTLEGPLTVKIFSEYPSRKATDRPLDLFASLGGQCSSADLAASLACGQDWSLSAAEKFSLFLREAAYLYEGPHRAEPTEERFKRQLIKPTQRLSMCAQKETKTVTVFFFKGKSGMTFGEPRWILNQEIWPVLRLINNFPHPG